MTTPRTLPASGPIPVPPAAPVPRPPLELVDDPSRVVAPAWRFHEIHHTRMLVNGSVASCALRQDAVNLVSSSFAPTATQPSGWPGDAP